MLEQIKEKLQDEETQRALLNGVSIITTFVATQVFAHYFSKGSGLLVEAIITKLHDTPVTTAK